MIPKSKGIRAASERLQSNSEGYRGANLDGRVQPSLIFIHCYSGRYTPGPEEYDQVATLQSCV